MVGKQEGSGARFGGGVAWLGGRWGDRLVGLIAYIFEFVLDARDAFLEFDEATAEIAADFGQTSAEDQQRDDSNDEKFSPAEIGDEAKAGGMRVVEVQKQANHIHGFGTFFKRLCHVIIPDKRAGRRFIAFCSARKLRGRCSFDVVGCIYCGAFEGLRAYAVLNGRDAKVTTNIDRWATLASIFSWRRIIHMKNLSKSPRRNPSSFVSRRMAWGCCLFILCGLVAGVAGCDSSTPSSDEQVAQSMAGPGDDLNEAAVSTAISSATPAGTQTVMLQIKGMHCDGCKILIQEKLLDMPGVEAAVVSSETALATVQITAHGPSTQAMADVIASLGDSYSASAYKESDEATDEVSEEIVEVMP